MKALGGAAAVMHVKEPPMNSAAAVESHVHHLHVVHAAMPPNQKMCSWCGEPVRRKPVSGARLSHTICKPCAQQFLAQSELERNSRWI